MKSPNQKIIGRGAQIEPPNRFESVVTEADLEQLEHDEQLAQDDRRIPTEFFADDSRASSRITTAPTSPSSTASIPTAAANTVALTATPAPVMNTSA